MANTIQHKRSSTSGVAPAASGLSQGELAINIADGKLYTKNNSNAVINLGVTSISGTYITPASGNFSNSLQVNGVQVSVSGHNHDKVTSAGSLSTAVFNKTGNVIPKFSVVYINGGQGDQPTINLAIGDGESGSSKTYGITAEAISNMASGTVIVAGALTGVNTDQFNPTAPTGDVNGSGLWLSPSVSGGLTLTKPSAPNHAVYVATIVRTHQNAGVVEVRVQNGFELQELHNVALNGTTNGQFLQYNSGSGLWVASSSGNFTSLNLNSTGVVASTGGTSNYLSKFTGSNTIGNSLVFDNGTNVGIGTSSPSANFDVVGSGHFSDTIISDASVQCPSLASDYLFARDDFDLGIAGTINVSEFTTLSHLYWSINDDGLGNFANLQVDSNDVWHLGNLPNAVNGTGVANHIAYWNSSSGIIADSGQLYWDSTNNRLGIGISNPSGQLHVAGDTYIDNSAKCYLVASGYSKTMNYIWSATNGNLQINGGGPHLVLSSQGGYAELGGTASTYINIGHSYNAGTSAQNIRFTPANTERMRLDTNGNLGIGTTNPLERIHISGQQPTVRLNNTLGYDTQLRLIDTVSDWSVGINQGNAVGSGFFNIRSNTAAANRLTIDTNGRVGIGTITPTSQLHVIGSGLFSGDVTANVSFIGGSGTAALPSFEFVNDPDTGLFSPSANAFAISTSGVERLRVNNIGNIGIGISAPSGRLNIHGGIGSDYTSACFTTDGVATTTHIGVGNSDTRPFLASLNGNLSSSTFGWGFFDRGTEGDLVLSRKGGSTSWIRSFNVQRSNGFIGIGSGTQAIAPPEMLTVDGNLRLADKAGSTGNKIQFNRGGGTANDYTIGKEGNHLAISTANDGTTFRFTEFGYHSGSTWTPKTRVNNFTGALAVNYTSAPSGQLHVGGSGIISSRLGIGTGSPGASLDVRGNSIFNEDGGDFDFRIESDTDPNMFFVDASTNNIGIGYAAPTTKLQVNGTFSCGSSSDPAAGGQGIYIDPSVPSLSFNDSIGPNITTVLDDNGIIVYDFSSNAVLSTDRYSNRVGIGTSSPSTTLDVNGSLKTLGFSSYGTSWFGSSDGTIGVGANSNPSGTFSSTAAFGAFQGFNAGVTAYNDLCFTAGFFPQIFLKTNGNVGINTANPTTKLHVNGFISQSAVHASAGLSTDQTIPSGVDTVLQLTDKDDPNSWWNATTYRFLPTVSGYYFIAAQVNWDPGAGTGQINIQLRKNGTSFSLCQNAMISGVTLTQHVNGIVNLNGSTDYVELTAFTGTTNASQIVNGTADRAWTKLEAYKIS